MPVSPVSLCADLQAWHSAGLSFLYFSDLDARELLKNAPRQMAARRLQAQGHAPQADAPDTAAAPDTPGASKAPAAAAAASQCPSRPVEAAAMPEQTQKTAMSVANISSSVSQNIPLPKAWEAVLTKVKPAPVVWTYLELGEDLMIKGDPARSAALRELIGGLGLKGGTSAFLPVVLPGCPADGSEGWCFQSLLGRLGGRILVSFGPEALALGPYAMLGLEPFQEKIVQGRIILCLPSFAEILADQGRFEATKVFLRSAFAKINIM